MKPEDVEVLFAEPLALTEGAAGALEDYARILARAAAAEVLQTPGGGPDAPVRGVRLRGVRAPLPEEVEADVQAFARGLAQGAGGGLGWS